MVFKEDIDNYKNEQVLFIFRSKWYWWIPGAIFSFLFASILMSGWPTGLLPNISYPYVYEGDGLSHSWLAQRAIEGWIFENPRSGYPFGSSFLDYPGSDSGNLLILKILGLMTGNYYSAFNLFFLLSFAFVFVTSFCVLNKLGVSSALSFSGAILYSFLPFHFQRLGHSFYLWYFVAPIFFYLGFFCFSSEYRFSKSAIKKSLLLFLLCILIASFGVYYALFGVILLIFSGIAGYLKKRDFASLKNSIIITSMVIFGVIINVAPNIVNKVTNGSNPEVAVRSPAEAEIYGFKLTQLLLPRSDHRNASLASMAQRYNSDRPLINENVTSTLGSIGGLGLVGIFIIILTTLSGRIVDSRLSLLAMMVLVLFLFGTIGGLGSIFSSTISSSIRGWNRISIFIGFGAIAAFFIALQLLIDKYFDLKNRKILFVSSTLLFTFLGLYDQTVPACLACAGTTRNNFELDKNFITEIERSLPENSAVYQLPYMRFPETGSLYRLHTYDLAAGFLHSKTLRWSYAGMKGRNGDLFYRMLSQESIEKQIQVIKNLGFSGIYIDRRGFKDNGDLIINNLLNIFGNDSIIKRSDGEVVFFKIPQQANIDLYKLSNEDIIEKAGYSSGSKLGIRHPAKLSDGIDFTQLTWPNFIHNIKGISGAEPWGRWSDANLNRSVDFEFSSPLPRNFVLVLKALAFSRDGEQYVAINIGKQEWQVILKSDTTEIRLPISLKNDEERVIKFIPKDPVSPQTLGQSADDRKLGVGFIGLRLEN